MLELILKLFIYLVVLVGVLYLAYITTKFVAKGAGPKGMSGNIQILEKTPLGRDSCLLIVQVQERYLLLGVTPSGIEKLQELDHYEPKKSVTAADSDFAKLLAGRLKDGKDKLLNGKKSGGSNQ
ncbi:flagellar biosynthetic protein FliO [Diplocloster agilis]|uniref:Flagellar biosynthetic protein FliO n=1 Tax=Diplocloster agilis TaxID=2850323 RepID=A0A949K5C0_9FIRM|nr:flagellar biosynthetic protein FliO [Diplocloster agilis]MBU9739375.1 flagellar biosynthetic protein FliO [Diplocloster agilis]MBU9744642.1 flagellar biosynthetic protein FliO [Diplocloster agilis]